MEAKALLKVKEYECEHCCVFCGVYAVVEAHEAGCPEALKVNTATAALDAGKRDEDARRAAKGGYAGGRQLAAKGRRVHRRQHDKFAGKAVGKQLATVDARGGQRGPSAGAGRSAARNPLRPGAQAGRSGGPEAWGANGGRCRSRQMEQPFGRST